jgi:AbrB family looped-hinge helix DNA binding protein
MAKITSKLQITIPKRIADQYGIAPGDEIEFVPAGDVIHLVTPRQRPKLRVNPEERLRLFDAATARQRKREKHMMLPEAPREGRDWKREDLYTRGKPR